MASANHSDILLSAGWDKSKNQAYWTKLWGEGLEQGTRFDACASVPLLQKFVAEGRIPKGRVLIPGCGRGYDVALLASADREAYGLDIVPKAVEQATEYLNSLNLEHKANARVLCEDFFAFPSVPSSKGEVSSAEGFDFIFDYTFLCALDPSMREAWARRMFELLKPGGVLMTLVFPILPENLVRDFAGNNDAEAQFLLQGPPFIVSLDIVKNLCEGAGFKKGELRLITDEEAHEGRQGKSGLGWWVKP